MCSRKRILRPLKTPHDRNCDNNHMGGNPLTTTARLQKYGLGKVRIHSNTSKILRKNLAYQSRVKALSRVLDAKTEFLRSTVFCIKHLRQGSQASSSTFPGTVFVVMHAPQASCTLPTRSRFLACSLKEIQLSA